MLPPYSMDSERSKPLLRDGDLWTAEDTLNTFTGADKNWCCQSVTVTSTVSSGTLPHVTLLNMLTVIRLCRFTRLLPSAVWQLNDLKVFSAVQNNLTGESDFFQTLSKCTSTNKHSDFWGFFLQDNRQNKMLTRKSIFRQYVTYYIQITRKWSESHWRDGQDAKPETTVHDCVSTS